MVQSREGYPSDSIPGLRRSTIPLEIGSPMLEGTHRFDNIPGREWVGVISRYGPRERLQPRELHLGRTSYLAVWDSSIAVATGEHGYEIERHTADGRIVERVRADVQRRPVTQAMRDAKLARFFAPSKGTLDKRFVEEPTNMSEAERQIRATPFADSLPPTGRIFATKAKNLWVVDGASPLDTGWTATAFRRDGAIIARLHSPYGREPMYMGGDRIVVNVPDSAGAYSLRVYRLSKPLTTPMRLGAR